MKSKSSAPTRPVAPREVALKVLSRWQAGDSGTLDEILDAALEELKSGDGPAWWPGWLQEVCSGVVRWRGRLDSVIDHLALTKKPAGNLRRHLWVAIYQLLVLEAPPGAVVDEAVGAVKRHEGLPQSRFVNALLRKITSHLEEYRKWPEPSSSNSASGKQLEAEAQWASVPQWWWKRLVQAYGKDWAKAYCRAGLERPTVWIRARPGSTVTIENAASGPVAGSLAIPEGVRVRDLPGLSEGKLFVQDLSSQILVDEVSRLLKIKGLRVLDLCAAPGGKSVGLAWNGAQVTATDLPGVRFQRLQENLSRLTADDSAVAQGLEKVAQLAAFDAVWVDAPCTGSGILRRHPDVRWSKTEKDLQSLQQLQNELLLRGAGLVRKGGSLVYSVCSVFPDEGADQVKRFSQEQGWKIIKEWLLSPNNQGGDGFYGAVLSK